MTSAVALLTIREWKFEEGRLCSLAFKDIWHSSEVFSGYQPDIGSPHGIYSVLPEKFEDMRYAGRHFPQSWHVRAINIAGVVANRGRIQIHEDGTVRSQSVEIVRLFVDSRWISPKQADELQRFYAVPLVYTNDVFGQVKKWQKANAPQLKAQSGLIEAYKVPEERFLAHNPNIIVEIHEPALAPPTPVSARAKTAGTVGLLGIMFMLLALFALLGISSHPQILYESPYPASTVGDVASTTKYLEVTKDLGQQENGKYWMLIQEKPATWWMHYGFTFGTAWREWWRLKDNTKIEAVIYEEVDSGSVPEEEPR